jgi:hypothetical protein
MADDESDRAARQRQIAAWSRTVWFHSPWFADIGSDLRVALEGPGGLAKRLQKRGVFIAVVVVVAEGSDPIE